jgi:hypothetical protein
MSTKNVFKAMIILSMLMGQNCNVYSMETYGGDIDLLWFMAPVAIFTITAVIAKKLDDRDARSRQRDIRVEIMNNAALQVAVQQAFEGERVRAAQREARVQRDNRFLPKRVVGCGNKRVSSRRN